MTHVSLTERPSVERHLTYLGHATVLLELDGVRLLTDPILRGWVGPLRRQGRAVDPSQYERVDAVLLSHLHYDHADRGSLALLDRGTRLLAPAGAGQLLRGWGFRHAEELSPGNSTDIGPLRIEATWALHDGFRPPFGPRTGCLGFVIAGSRQIYFAGDTDLFPEMRELGAKLDVALLPVWGWGPTLGRGHLDPYRAAVALTLLQPRCAVPIHWGSLAPIGLRWLRPSVWQDPPHTFARYGARMAPGVHIAILPPGGSLTDAGWR